METTKHSQNIEKRYPKYAELTRHLKEKYYNEEDLNEIRDEYDSRVKEYCESARPHETEDLADAFLVTEIKYDREDAWGCRPYSLLVKKEDQEKASTLLKDALREYYSCCYFHDNVTDLLPRDIVRIFAAEADFPIIMFFSENEPCKNAASDCRIWYAEED